MLAVMINKQKRHAQMFPMETHPKLGHTLTQPPPPQSLMEGQNPTLRQGQTHKVKELAEQLTSLQYHNIA